MTSKLIIDSGATSWNYALLYDGQILEGRLKGYNAYIHQEDTFLSNLERMKSDIGREPDQIYFYGAGIAGTRQQRAQEVFTMTFPKSQINAFSDIIAVAHASLSRKPIWVGILGTGSNLALFDGKKIIHSIHSMGYIFGDEGSGRDILKRLVLRYYRGGLTQGTRDLLSNFITQDYPEFMEAVYRDGQWPIISANWMANLSEHWDHPEVKRIARESIGSFQGIMINAQAYQKAPLYLVGGVAQAYKVYICNLWKECAATPIEVASSPLPGLIKYYQNEH
jgi:N-acetylglucosamine kinase-like BadF-type ATPase